jgi:hypothetical protein
MNNLLFTALAIALIYYFFFYLPTQKSISNPSLTNNQTQTEREVENKEVQTETEENKDELITSLKADIQQKENTIIGLNNSYERLEQSSQRLETNKDEQIKELRKELELVSQEVNFFTKNKELIKEAIEFHQDYIAHFLPTNFTPSKPEEIETKLKELTTKFKEAEAKGETESAKHFSKQMEVFTQTIKNERIVKEGKELLEKLKDYE